MKDSFGTMTAIWVFMIFFIIYVCFIAMALQYAKAYRIKNTIITYLETNQYTPSDDSTSKMITDYLASVPYNFDTASAQASNACKAENGKSVTYVSGVCIIEEGDIARYYKVVVFIPFEFPFLNIGYTAIPVSGETKVIYYTS